MKKQKQVFYEWDCETVAAVNTDDFAEGDILDHAHGATLAEVLKWSRQNPPDPGTRHEIVLVRDDADCRSWAYLDFDGNLPEFFEDAAGTDHARVPKRFHAQTTRS